MNQDIRYADGGQVSVETILFGVRIGEPDWKEILITNNPHKIEDAKKWALANGFDRLRVSKIDMMEKPNFEKTSLEYLQQKAQQKVAQIMQEQGIDMESEEGQQQYQQGIQQTLSLPGIQKFMNRNYKDNFEEWADRILEQATHK